MIHRAIEPTKGSPSPLKPQALRRICDPSQFPFETTAQVEALREVVGQESAVEALAFGLATRAPGQNVYVRGLSGTGRLTLLRQMLQHQSHPCVALQDICFVHNFQQKDQPRLIMLPCGQGREFSKQMEALAGFIADDLPEALSSDGIKEQKQNIEADFLAQIEKLVEPFNQSLEQAGLKVVTFQSGKVMQSAVVPAVDGKPLQPEAFEALHREGKITDEQYQATKENLLAYSQKMEEINSQAHQLRRAMEKALQEVFSRSARWILNEVSRDIAHQFDVPAVHAFIAEALDFVLEYGLTREELGEEMRDLLRVNVVSQRSDATDCPVVAEHTPSLRNLLGTIDYEFGPDDQVRANHMGIREGSLLRARGGYLIVEARDILEEPGAWNALKRTLRTGQLEMVPSDWGSGRMGPTLKPEPIPFDAKVILLGDAQIYHMLDGYDPDFSRLFKVLADFDSVIPRNDTARMHYAGVLSKLASDEQLPPFDRTAVAALVEQGSRIAERADLLTTRFSRIADIAREGAFIAQQAQQQRVTGQDIKEAIRRGKRRADLPSRRYRDYVSRGIIRLQVKGEAIGQVNGLAVMGAGPLTYGFPARITATIGPGTAGVINIEREAELSGAIHTKGFYILGGLLRHLLHTEHPLAFSASIAFEQSYGGIDGDSASGAEMCCLLSALTGIPLRGDLAMTGAIDQLGHILAIGAVNEKIEGFFDTCQDQGFTGTQGVIIPASCQGDLMLREDVVQACEKGVFSVFAVNTIHEALELFTRTPAGQLDESGRYPAHSVLGRAVEKAREYWKQAAPFTRSQRSDVDP